MLFLSLIYPFSISFIIIQSIQLIITYNIDLEEKNWYYQIECFFDMFIMNYKIKTKGTSLNLKLKSLESIHISFSNY